MIELIFLGILICVILYLLYVWYYSNIEQTNEFITQVYQYLKKRYKKTEIDEYGGDSLNPQIVSHEAGPFKQITVKIESQRSGRGNQDLIIWGAVETSKYQKGNFPVRNLSVYLKFYHTIGKGIQTSDPVFDSRFLVLSPDPNFALRLLTQSNLGTLIKRSYDLKAYEISWRGATPRINIKMDTVNLNSFIRAFSILLGSVGTLTELGYLIRETSKENKSFQSFKIPQIEERTTPRSEGTERVITSSSQVATLQKINQTNLELKTIPTITSASIPPAPTIKQKFSENKESDDEILSLFSSIMYQVQNILIEESCVKIRPLSADDNDIIVTFPEENLILFTVTSHRPLIIQFELFIKSLSVQEKDWSNPWQNITIEGTSELTDKLRSRIDIANLLSTEQIEISSRGSPKDGINLSISVEKSYEGIKIGYRVIRDLLWFLKTELSL